MEVSVSAITERILNVKCEHLPNSYSWTLTVWFH